MRHLEPIQQATLDITAIAMCHLEPIQQATLDITAIAMCHLEPIQQTIRHYCNSHVSSRTNTASNSTLLQ